MLDNIAEIYEDTFKDKNTKRIWERNLLKKGISLEIQERTYKRLIPLFAFGYSLEEIERFFGSKNFERLKGDRKGQYSIRVNDQYRICFKWKNNRPYEIEFNKHYWD